MSMSALFRCVAPGRALSYWQLVWDANKDDLQGARFFAWGAALCGAVFARDAPLISTLLLRGLRPRRGVLAWGVMTQRNLHSSCR